MSPTPFIIGETSGTDDPKTLYYYSQGGSERFDWPGFVGLLDEFRDVVLVVDFL